MNLKTRFSAAALCVFFLAQGAPAAEGVREAVLAGLGLTITSGWMFARELENGAVREVLRDWSLPPLDLWALFPSGRRASAKARAFAAFVEDILAAPRLQRR